MHSFYRMIIIQTLWLILLLLYGDRMPAWRLLSGYCLVGVGALSFIAASWKASKGQYKARIYRYGFQAFILFNLLLALLFITHYSTMPTTQLIEFRIRAIYLALIMLFFSILLSEDRRIQLELEKLVSERTAMIKVESERLKTVLRHLQGGVLLTDSEGRIILTNQYLISLTGITREDLMDSNLSELPLKSFSDALKNIRSGSSEEVTLKMPEGDRTLEIEMAHIDESNAGSLYVIRDITAMKAMINMKDDFVSRISSALMSPLNLISANLEPVIDGIAGEISSEAGDYLTNASEGVEQLNGTLRKLLDFSEMEAGSYQYFQEECDISEDVIDPLIEELIPVVAGKSVEIKIDIDKELPKINIDKDAVISCLRALISDALLSFTEPGWLNIKAYPSDKKVIISITDNAAQVNEENLKAIFTGGKSRGASPVDMAMAARIATDHNGSVSCRTFTEKAESGSDKLDSGAEFTLKLPLEKTS